MTMTHPDNSSLADIRARHDALAAAEPKLRIRDRAERLGVAEAQLVAADCGLSSTELHGPFQTVLREVGALGEVMALSRNAWCVHERHGVYEDIQAEGPVGLVLGPDIDLRLFFSAWKFGYAVLENGRRSLQFFDKAGVAVHKIYRTDATDGDAWDALVARFAQADKSLPATESIAPADEAREAADPAALRAHWLALEDTHEFHGMLRKFKLSRTGALRAAGADLAQPVANDTVETVLQSAAEQQLPLMCFVANRGIVQIHTGAVKKLVRTGPWFNVLDPKFNLHLDTTAIASTWIVNKPTRDDGWVTSLEAFSQSGELIVQFFGERKPGRPELKGWRELLLGRCAEPLAA